MEHQQTRILIADDTPVNVHVLTSALAAYGYEIHAVSSGDHVLEAAHELNPDLILLDIRMPIMDGYEVCQALKAHADLREIPVIFISALGDITEKVRGLQSGAVDYITRPFQVSEVIARVQTQLELYHQRQEIERLRLREHLLAEKLAAWMRDAMGTASHDLRNPLAGINLSVHLLRRYGRIDDDKGQELLERIQENTARMATLITDLLDVARVDDVQQDTARQI